MSDQSLGTVVGVQTTLLAVSVTRQHDVLALAAAPGVTAVRAAAVAAAAAGVAAARGGGSPQEAIRQSRWWSRIV